MLKKGIFTQKKSPLVVAISQKGLPQVFSPKRGITVWNPFSLSKSAYVAICHNLVAFWLDISQPATKEEEEEKKPNNNAGRKEAKENREEEGKVSPLASL